MSILPWNGPTPQENLSSAEGEVLDKRQLKNSELKEYIDKKVPKETFAVWKGRGTGHTFMIY